MLKYWILITENEQGDIISLYSPDLKKELLEKVETKEVVELKTTKEATDIRTEFRSITRQKLTASLDSRHKILLPKRFQQLEHIPITYLQHWECFKISPNKKRRIFEKTLPVTGYVFNIAAILTNLFITYMALKIAANRDNNNSATSTVLAIVGSLFNSLINCFVYVMSGASDTLIETGYRFDNLCRKEDIMALEMDGFLPSRKQICKVVGLSLAAGGCILANTLIAGVRQYQEFILLTGKFLELNDDLSEDDRKKFFNLIKSLTILPNIVATSYCAVAFQGSFARKLITSFTDKSAQVRVNETTHSQHTTFLNRLTTVTHALSLTLNSGADEETMPLEPNNSSLYQFQGQTNLQSSRFRNVSDDLIIQKHENTSPDIT